MFALGRCYEYGIGVTPDAKKAFEWYGKSAEAGNDDAMCALVKCYAQGIGVTPDEAKAFEWFQKVAEAGDGEATCEAGLCYAIGFLAPKDEAKAFESFQKAAEAGTSVANFYLGVCYAQGIGVARDETKAFELIQKEGLRALGPLAPPDFAGAAEKKGEPDEASIGSPFAPEAAIVLAWCYELGIGAPKNEKLAFELIQKASQAPITTQLATLELGRYYKDGIGTPKNEIEAFESFQKAAEMGNVDAMFRLWNCYEAGIGAPKDRDKAETWRRKAMDAVSLYQNPLDRFERECERWLERVKTERTQNQEK